MMLTNYTLIRKANGVTMAVRTADLAADLERAQATGKPATAPKAAPKAAPKGAATLETAPSSFGARLRGILELPEARHRQRQALAIAAETSCSVREAGVILAGLPLDREAGAAHGAPLFPGSTVQLDAEGARIMAITQSPEAEGRMAQALNLALGTTLDPATARALLAKAPASSAILSIADRAAGEHEFGGSFEDVPQGGKSGRIDQIWKTSTERLNRQSERFDHAKSK